MSTKISASKIQHMNALADDRGVIAAAAMDQRGSLQKAIAAGKNIDKGDVTDEMMTEFKTAVGGEVLALRAYDEAPCGEP